MKMLKKNISVVIPCYNSENSILKCLESVVRQSYPIFEVLIIDDGSTDNTCEVVSYFIHQNNLIDKLFYFKQKNSGPSTARNFGISKSKGDYIAFLDSDDYWKEDKIEIQMSYIAKDQSVFLCACAFGKKRFTDKIIVKEITFKELLYKNYFSTPTVIVNSEVFKNGHKFNDSIKYSEDYRLWLDIAYSYKCIYINKILANNQFHKLDFGVSGLSASLTKMEKGELRNYLYLWKKHKISFLQLFKVSAFSILKFFRRYAIVKIK